MSKKRNHYHFSFDFLYIDDNHDDAYTTMEVDMDWNSSSEEYDVHYSCPDEHLIREENGNDDLYGIFKDIIVCELYDKLDEVGVPVEIVNLYETPEKSV